jgi:threonine aldolase
MYRAELGDDVYGEDPTVNGLEELAAERLGKQSALLVASGTMGNLVSLLTHCGRGDEAIMGRVAHTFLFEVGAISALGGVHVSTVPNLHDGTLDPAEVRAAIRGDNIHLPRSRVLCLENTHNRCGGAPLSPDQMRPLCEIAHENGLQVHLDGARIFNASIALNIDPKEIAAPADSVMFCLSKGLAAPIGSLVCGTAEFIREARRNRKMVGGGMRQAGIIAAAGIVALEQMVDRLADDHANARLLAEGLAEVPGVDIQPDDVRTNIVIFGLSPQVMSADEYVRLLSAQGIKIGGIGGNRFRAVTHYGVERQDILFALSVVEEVVTGGAG